VSVNGALLAQFLEEITTEEQLLLQQLRDLEGVPVREAIVGQRYQVLKSSESQAQEDDEELDLAALPQYEEYR
jgi:putative transposase